MESRHGDADAEDDDTRHGGERRGQVLHFFVLVKKLFNSVLELTEVYSRAAF